MTPTPIVENLFSYFSNKKISLSRKASTVVILLVVIIGLDIWLKASFRFRTMNRMTVLKEANTLIADPQSDSLTVAYAVRMRNMIVVPRDVPKAITLDYKPAGSRGRDKVTFLMSCSGLFAAILVIVAFRRFFREGHNEENKPPIEIVFANNILSVFIFVLISYVIAFGMQFIPPLALGWNVNYAIGYFLQVIALIFVVRKIKLRSRDHMEVHAQNYERQWKHDSPKL